MAVSCLQFREGLEKREGWGPPAILGRRYEMVQSTFTPQKNKMVRLSHKNRIFSGGRSLCLSVSLSLCRVKRTKETTHTRARVTPFLFDGYKNWIEQGSEDLSWNGLINCALVCIGHLLFYCRAWKEREENLERVARKASG